MGHVFDGVTRAQQAGAPTNAKSPAADFVTAANTQKPHAQVRRMRHPNSNATVV
jgi:hypothetical protein